PRPRLSNRIPSRDSPSLEIKHGRHLKLKMWLGPESNRRHADFQSAALPTELPSREEAHLSRKPPTLNTTSRFKTFVAIRSRVATTSNTAPAKFQSRRIVPNAASSIGYRAARISSRANAPPKRPARS